MVSHRDTLSSTLQAHLTANTHRPLLVVLPTRTPHLQAASTRHSNRRLATLHLSTLQLAHTERRLQLHRATEGTHHSLPLYRAVRSPNSAGDVSPDYANSPK